MPRWSVDGDDQPSIDNLCSGDVNRTEEGNLSEISQWLVPISPGYFYQVCKLHPLLCSPLHPVQPSCSSWPDLAILHLLCGFLPIKNYSIIDNFLWMSNYKLGIVIEKKSTDDVSFTLLILWVTLYYFQIRFIILCWSLTWDLFLPSPYFHSSRCVFLWKCQFHWRQWSSLMCL